MRLPVTQESQGIGEVEVEVYGSFISRIWRSASHTCLPLHFSLMFSLVEWYRFFRWRSTWCWIHHWGYYASWNYLGKKLSLPCCIVIYAGWWKAISRQWCNSNFTKSCAAGSPWVIEQSYSIYWYELSFSFAPDSLTAIHFHPMALFFAIPLVH